jgi:hypothetical protein
MTLCVVAKLLRQALHWCADAAAPPLLLTPPPALPLPLRRTNIKFSHCGTASSLTFAINHPPAAAAAAPAAAGSK